MSVGETITTGHLFPDITALINLIHPGVRRKEGRLPCLHVCHKSRVMFTSLWEYRGVTKEICLWSVIRSEKERWAVLWMCNTFSVCVCPCVGGSIKATVALNKFFKVSWRLFNCWVSRGGVSESEVGLTVVSDTHTPDWALSPQARTNKAGLWGLNTERHEGRKGSTTVTVGRIR